MGVLTGLVRDLTARLSGRRLSTPDEVRELLDKRDVDRAALALDSLAPHVPERELVLLCLRGEVAFRRHDDDAADRLFREALALAPGLADAHYGLSLVMLARADQESAVRHAQFAVNLGSAPRFSAQLGLCQLAQGNYVRAKEALTRATRLDPHDKSSWNNLGIVRRAIGQFAAARTAFERALEIDADFDRAADNLRLLDQDVASKRITFRDVIKAPTGAAVAIDPEIEQLRSLRDAGQVDAAIDQCESLCSEHADRVDLVIELAHLYGERGDTQSGIDVLQAFVARHDGNIRAVAALGRMLVDHQDFKAARPLVERAHQAEPEDVGIMMSLAEVRTEQGRFADAGALVERANALLPSLDMKGRLAASLCVRCKYEECLTLIDEMLAEEPAAAPDVMGIQVDAMTALGRHDEALPLLDAAIERSPNDPNRRFLRATVSLLREDFATGWDDYAFRNLQSVRHLRMLPFPLWRGESIEGKAILVAIEQGIGDQVMFASCIADLERLAPSRIVLEFSDRLAKTITRSFPRCEVIASRQDHSLEWLRAVGTIDYFVMLGDLPSRFRRSVADFPRHARRTHWSAAIGGQGRPRIGLSWRGGTELTRTSLRSVDVTNFATLATCVDADWVCLQYGDVKGDLDRAERTGLTMQYWPESIADLDEFAALVSSLDLVISVCNTTVHYAGALGIPVWVVAPKVPEWRYGIKFRSMPWYPSSLMYRQDTAGEWSSVVERVRGDLASWLPACPHGASLVTKAAT